MEASTTHLQLNEKAQSLGFWRQRFVEARPQLNGVSQLADLFPNLRIESLVS
jgi:hypothetical protein